VTSDASLRVEGISVRLGGQEILRHVDLEVLSGQVVGVLGPSGAGKSTLFRVIAGELVPQAGRVLLSNRDLGREPLWMRARRGLGYVPQTPSILFDLSVAENIRTFERAARVARRPLEERADSVELASRLDVRARELSGGERRRLELLRALIANPAVLVCDEPLAGIDPAAAGRIVRRLRALAESGSAVLLADHRMREALAACDRALLLLDGRIELSAPPAEFSDHPAVRRRYLG
jgi:lipopolysaccharide export system ATP-binding protein